MKITKIELWISNFEKTIEFYRDTLEFPLLSHDSTTASFQIGSSLLQFHHDSNQKFHYYHFAFNIPPNLFQSAKSWLANRTTLLTEDDQDEVFFDGLTQADSCYIEDPAGNIMEYIARRKTTPESLEQEFTPDQVSSISEIGLSTEQVGEYAQRIQDLGIPVRGNEEIHLELYLNFMGEYEEGNFIILSPVGRRWYFSTKLAIDAPLIIHTNRGMIEYPSKHSLSKSTSS
ncbi:VOC family protein [Saccharibacillus sp. JS10]|uniref:VOC family protein n=1 Tax=Saccharibacillus sp. JS10 TaxID=2950552 RepID=UPI00210AAE57|nr:VOC family protein [Saccharibacillus sp. JS10]MCQ4087001.1 VOC family protein [Saccharibacillus sp. JS10]